jgi:hypothetical protein
LLKSIRDSKSAITRARKFVEDNKLTRERSQAGGDGGIRTLDTPLERITV